MIKGLSFTIEQILELAENLKRPEKEIISLHEIARKIIHVKS